MTAGSGEAAITALAAGGGPKLSLQARRQRAFAWFLYPSLTILALMTIVPAAYLLITSFTPLNLTRPQTAWDFSDPFFNYKIQPEDERFTNSLWVQAKLSLWTVSLQMLFGLALALLLNIKSGLLEALRTIFLIPMVLPPIVVALMFKVLYTPDISPVHQVLNLMGLPVPSLITHPDYALLAIVIADIWQWFPFAMLMILASLQMMPEEPLEAARIDGASAWQITWYVTLPYLRPVLLVSGLFRLIDSIKAFPLIYVLTDGGPGTVTEVTNYYAFVQAFNFSYIGFAGSITVVMVSATFLLSWWIMKLVGTGGIVE